MYAEWVKKLFEPMLIEYALSVVLEHLKKKLITTPKDKAPFFIKGY